MRIRNRHLVILLVVLAAAWFYLRYLRQGPLPWNVGQAGSIFQAAQGANFGGGQ